MQHTEAMDIKATEKYLLGELQGELREQFEEHFMECPECAKDLRAAAVFMSNAKEVFRAEKPALAKVPGRPGRGRAWIAAFLRPAIVVPVFAALVAIIAYQGGVAIPRLRHALSTAGAPRALASFSLIAANSRGGTMPEVAVQPDQPFSLYVDIPPQPSFPGYTCDIDNESGATELLLSISAQEAKNTVQFLIPASHLRPGTHVIVVRGIANTQAPSGSAVEVARFPFTLSYVR
ncbi:MAG TPA: zf-HC2 domain-containing protein [Candidatus Acidoferrales bacterium]|nr:zf-HC2 domain-containing protein [Candidatus Acidoferrales bacterium]